MKYTVCNVYQHEVSTLSLTTELITVL